jgi:GNAT superfamily N-acetyltransferase
MVAVDAAHRGRGIGRSLMAELVRRVKAAGHPLIALGARKEAEGLYLKCGFLPTLFLQSKKHSLAELRAVNDRHGRLAGPQPISSARESAPRGDDSTIAPIASCG